MKITVSLAILVVALTIGSQDVSSDEEQCGIDSNIARKYRRAIVRLHNNLRRKEKNAAALMQMAWSEELARRASEQASTCEFKQTILKDCAGQYMGQNMYLESGALPGSVDINWNRILRSCWRGGKYYNHGESLCTPNENCGQYMMMARNVYNEVGCSYARCPVITMTNGRKLKNSVIYVCNYRGTGQPTQPNGAPYALGEPCSKCETVAEKGYVCKDKLCVECTRRNNKGCTCIPKTCSAGGRFSNNKCQCVCNKGWWGDKCDIPCACENTYPGGCQTLPLAFCAEPMFATWIRLNCAAQCPAVCTAIQPPSGANC